MEIQFTDIIQTASLLITFMLLAVFGSRNTWISADMLLSAGFGAAYLVVPGTLLDYQTEGTMDSASLFLARIYGIVLIGGSIIFYITKETRDGTVPITLMMSRVFMCSVTLMLQLYAHLGSVKSKGKVNWNTHHLSFGIFGIALWGLGNLMHLMKSYDFSTYPQHNVRLNTHLRADALLMVLLSVMLLAFPDFVMKSVFSKSGNIVHLHFLRCFGATFLGEAIVSLQAPGFLHERDKRAQFMARIILFVSLEIPFLIAALLSKLIALEQLTHVTLIIIIPLFNALVGYCTDGTRFYTPQKKQK